MHQMKTGSLLELAYRPQFTDLRFKPKDLGRPQVLSADFAPTLLLLTSLDCSWVFAEAQSKIDMDDKGSAFIMLNMLTLFSLNSFLFKILFTIIVTDAHTEASYYFSAFKVIFLPSF